MISFQTLWGCALGWLVGGILWAPVLGSGWREATHDALTVMFFIVMVWLYRKFCDWLERRRYTAPPTVGGIDRTPQTWWKNPHA